MNWTIKNCVKSREKKIEILFRATFFFSFNCENVSYKKGAELNLTNLLLNETYDTSYQNYFDLDPSKVYLTAANLYKFNHKTRYLRRKKSLVFFNMGKRNEENSLVFDANQLKTKHFATR